MACKYCILQDGEYAYTYYGIAPHAKFNIPSDITNKLKAIMKNTCIYFY